MRLFVIARHAQSTLNLERRVNGDPSEPVGLTDLGREEAALLAIEIANVAFDACFHTRFQRTRETAEVALAGRDVPFLAEPLLDDIDVGEFDLAPLDEYRAWKHSHPRTEPFPGGESLDDAARRYAAGWAKLLETPYSSILVICHEIPLRYALNGALGSDSLDGPVHELLNARPYLFDEEALARAVAGIERVLSVADARDGPS
jgi:broad specificity phosphatase PhoE